MRGPTDTGARDVPSALLVDITHPADSVVERSTYVERVIHHDKGVDRVVEARTHRSPCRVILTPHSNALQREYGVIAAIG